jgi:hypothetical protein
MSRSTLCTVQEQADAPRTHLGLWQEEKRPNHRGKGDPAKDVPDLEGQGGEHVRQHEIGDKRPDDVERRAEVPNNAVREKTASLGGDEVGGRGAAQLGTRSAESAGSAGSADDAAGQYNAQCLVLGLATSGYEFSQEQEDGTARLRRQPGKWGR